MKKFVAVLKRFVIVIVIIAVVIGALGTFYLKSYIPNTVAPKSFLKIDGEIIVPGLDGAVDVYRDGIGIPHIYATTKHDLFFAQGYVHAQERFWQMDFWRHIGSGRPAAGSHAAFRQGALHQAVSEPPGFFRGCHPRCPVVSGPGARPHSRRSGEIVS